METVATLSDGKFYALIAVIIAVIFAVYKLLEKKDIKFKDISLSSKSGLTERESIVSSILVDFDKNFSWVCASFLEAQKPSISDKLLSSVPKRDRIIVANCLTDSLMESICRNHLQIRLETQESFEEWLDGLRISYYQKLNRYFVFLKQEKGSEKILETIKSDAFKEAVQKQQNRLVKQVLTYYNDMLDNEILTLTKCSGFGDLLKQTKTIKTNLNNLKLNET